ncbi:hypothetical protein B0H17DRAFT_1207272 [Mycena rosella]|uniref:Uncharacterized protein n=1 Tax=Mycena rosella TaxID=1033263 RepID=A0AAD7D3Q4_MYCRO|nr:hypothetical protein B0H17DRAFT_1207272 [Mycena rosella]
MSPATVIPASSSSRPFSLKRLRIVIKDLFGGQKPIPALRRVALRPRAAGVPLQSALKRCSTSTVFPLQLDDSASSSRSSSPSPPSMDIDVLVSADDEWNLLVLGDVMSKNTGSPVARLISVRRRARALSVPLPPPAEWNEISFVVESDEKVARGSQKVRFLQEASPEEPAWSDFMVLNPIRGLMYVVYYFYIWVSGPVGSKDFLSHMYHTLSCCFRVAFV